MTTNENASQFTKTEDQKNQSAYQEQAVSSDAGSHPETTAQAAAPQMENTSVNPQVQETASSEPQVIIVQTPKSVWLAVVLAFFFGPLGLLYSSRFGAIFMFLVCIIGGYFTFGLILLIMAPICALWAYIAAKDFNNKLFERLRASGQIG